MLWRMLPLQSRTSAIESGMRSASLTPASRKYDTSWGTPSSSTSMSLGPRPRTKRPVLS